MADRRHRAARTLSELCLMGQILFLVGGPKLVQTVWRLR